MKHKLKMAESNFGCPLKMSIGFYIRMINIILTSLFYLIIR